MSDVIEKKIKKEYDNADNKLKKVGVVAAVAGLSPAVAAGIVGEKAAVVAKGAAKKAKEMSIAAQLKYYNPLFPDVYESAAFTVPNMLMIVDDAVRKDVAVCEGAMGWLSNQGGIEVMHLYDEDINTSGLKFLPNPLCDAVYYVDPNHSDTYINIDSLFETFQQQKLAELARVAYCLGARHYSVEIIEEEKTSKKRSAQMEQSANVKIVKANATVSDDASMTKKAKRRSFTEEIYEEKRTPIKPELNWFKNDDIPTQFIISMLANDDFYNILSELIDFGLSRHERDYSNTYKDTDLVLYKKYTYEDVCRLLNWEKNEVPLNIGGYKFNEKTKTFPVFINYDKAEDISDTTKYEDHFTSSRTLIAISKSKRKMDSADVQNFLHAKERGINVELFVRKNKDDKISKEFYYLGRMTASGKAEEFIMNNTDESAVEIEWILDQPVREDIYEYIISA